MAGEGGLDEMHPLFMDISGEDGWDKYLHENPDLQALLSLDEEGTPEEAAESARERGNNAFKRANVLAWAEAVNHYSAALIKNPNGDPNIRSITYSNRAAANLELGNHGRVISDCKQAIELNPKNVKAYYRAAKALNALHRYKESLVFSQKGLELEPLNAALKKEEQLSLKRIEQNKQRAKATEEYDKDAVNSATHVYNTELLAKLKEHGVAIGMPLFDTQRQYEGKLYEDSDKVLHWPVMFIYEEFAQTDFIKDMSEQHIFQEHLAYMFPASPSAATPEVPFAPWDKDHHYTLESIELYIMAGAATPIGASSSPAKKRRWIKVRQTTNLGKVTHHPDYVVPHFPIIYVVSALSAQFKEAMLSRDLDNQ